MSCFSDPSWRPPGGPSPWRAVPGRGGQASGPDNQLCSLLGPWAAPGMATGWSAFGTGSLYLFMSGSEGICGLRRIGRELFLGAPGRGPETLRVHVWGQGRRCLSKEVPVDETGRRSPWSLETVGGGSPSSPGRPSPSGDGDVRGLERALLRPPPAPSCRPREGGRDGARAGMREAGRRQLGHEHT